MASFLFLHKMQIRINFSDFYAKTYWFEWFAHCVISRIRQVVTLLELTHVANVGQILYYTDISYNSDLCYVDSNH